MNELRIVDGLTLSAELRALLRPGEAIVDARENTHFLPRFFYEVDSWRQARETQLTAHFTLAEMMAVDCREADLLLNKFPHYVPCAVSVFSRYLEDFREKAGAAVYIAVNGGYRSPAHQLSLKTNVHSWGTAANIYRIGDRWMDSQAEIEKFATLAKSIAPEMYARSFGQGEKETDDHLHLDIGYISHVPRDFSEAR